MTQLQYDNIFDALTETGDEAADLQFRADLMLLLREYFRVRKASQSEIGKMLGVAQPRVSELMGGKIDKFSADKLIALLAKIKVRLKPQVSLGKRPEDLTFSCEVLAA